MAALSITHSLHTQKISVSHSRPSSKAQISVSCRIGEPSGSSSDSKKQQQKEAEKVEKPWILGFYGELEKMGKGVKDILSPKQKGDWKDVMLMSLSFAVYVYISQKIVCAYCAWMSILKHF